MGCGPQVFEDNNRLTRLSSSNIDHIARLSLSIRIRSVDGGLDGGNYHEVTSESLRVTRPVISCQTVTETLCHSKLPARESCNSL